MSAIDPEPSWDRPPPQRRNWPIVLTCLAIVAAGALIAAAIWVVKNDSRAYPTDHRASASSTPSTPIMPGVAAVQDPITAAAPCTAWRASIPARAAVPQPPAGWEYGDPGIDQALRAWADALRPILGDLAAAAAQRAPGDDLLGQYVTAQQSAIDAALAGRFSAADAQRVAVPAAALNAYCGL